MRLLELNNTYSEYLSDFYNRLEPTPNETFQERLTLIYNDAFAWADFWGFALKSHHVEVVSLPCNDVYLWTLWCNENEVPFIDTENAVVAFAQKFKPDLLWFGLNDTKLLNRILLNVQSIKLKFGWTGSAMPSNFDVFKQLDFVLSCAQEAVDVLVNQGIEAYQLHHGFDSRLIDKITPRKADNEVLFCGQIIRIADYHLEREKLLEAFIDNGVNLSILSQLPNENLAFKTKFYLRKGIYFGLNSLLALGMKVNQFPEKFRDPFWYQNNPLYPINKKLQPYIKNPVYGLAMYTRLAESSVVLNIHADTSPQFVSNMRLFEITGAGSCMLVDHKPNLKNLFEIDYEVVSFKSSAEAIDKAKWLINNPEKAKEIGIEGQKRTLKEHTFERRASLLIEIIQKKLTNAV